VGRFRPFALVLVLLCGRARAQEAPPTPNQFDAARTYYDAGVAAYERKDYDAALRAFHTAYATLPSPEFQYNIARCWERLGKWDFAANALERYLGGKTDVPDAGELRLHVLELRAKARDEEQRAVVASLPRPPERRTDLRIAAWAVLGGAVALGAAGTGAYLSEWSEYSERRDACAGTCSPESLQGLHGRVGTAQIVGGTLLGLAAAAAVVDVALWILTVRHR
jgi:tetratricopeptide (TPR) repeat protein